MFLLSIFCPLLYFTGRILHLFFFKFNVKSLDKWEDYWQQQALRFSSWGNGPWDKLQDNFTVIKSENKENKGWNKDSKLKKYIDIQHEHIGNFGEKVKVCL